MQMETEATQLSVLLKTYNQEMDRLKSKLLCGVPWEELEPMRTKITELAIAIHNTNHHNPIEYCEEKSEELVADIKFTEA